VVVRAVAVTVGSGAGSLANVGIGVAVSTGVTVSGGVVGVDRAVGATAVGVLGGTAVSASTAVGDEGEEVAEGGAGAVGAAGRAGPESGGAQPTAKEMATIRTAGVTKLTRWATCRIVWIGQNNRIMASLLGWSGGSG
jgi:hypothetical protein